MRTVTVVREYYEKCSLCKGEGKEGGVKEAKTCRQCKGSKMVMESKEVTVTRED